MNTCLTACERQVGRADCHYLTTASNNSAQRFFGEFICLLIARNSSATSPRRVGSGWRTVAEGGLVEGVDRVPGDGDQTLSASSTQRYSYGSPKQRRDGQETADRWWPCQRRLLECRRSEQVAPTRIDPGRSSCHQPRKLPPEPRTPLPQRKPRRRLPSRSNTSPPSLANDHDLPKKRAEAVLGDLVTLTTQHLKKGDKSV